MVDTFNPRYTYTKRGIYYFCKDVPVNLGHHTKLRIVQSLRTKSPIRATHSAQSLVARLQDYWCNLRLKEAQKLEGKKIGKCRLWIVARKQRLLIGSAKSRCLCCYFDSF